MKTETMDVSDLELVERPAAAPTPPSFSLAETSPTEMMMTAMERGASLEQIEKMMGLRERWKKGEAEDAFRKDFAAFRGENIIIPKTGHVDRGRAGSFVQAEYDVACRMLSPALSRHGFGFRHDMKFGLRRIIIAGEENDVGWVWVTCHLEHRQGHAERLELEGPPGDLTANTPVQNMQATASFLKRQGLLAITGTATGGEDDESKLRNGKGRNTDDSQGDDGNADESLRMAGQDAAMSGLKSLTDWWGSLTSKERSRLNDHFGGWRKVATKAGA